MGNNRPQGLTQDGHPASAPYAAPMNSAGEPPLWSVSAAAAGDEDEPPRLDRETSSGLERVQNALVLARQASVNGMQGAQNHITSEVHSVAGWEKSVDTPCCSRMGSCCLLFLCFLVIAGLLVGAFLRQIKIFCRSVWMRVSLMYARGGCRGSDVIYYVLT